MRFQPIPSSIYLSITLRVLLLIAILAGCWPLSLDLQAQNAKKDQQAVDLLSRVEDALGLGRNAVSKISALGNYTQWGPGPAATYPLRLKVFGFDKVQWEIDKADGTVVVAVQSAGGSQRFRGKEKDLAVSDTAGLTMEYVPVLAVGYWLKSPDSNLAYIDQQTYDGKKLHRVSIKRILRGKAKQDLMDAYEKSTRLEFFIDSQTNLPDRLRYYEHPGDWRVDLPVDLLFSNFQEVAGVLIPHTVTRYRGQLKTDTIQFHSFALNPSLESSTDQP